MKVTYLKENKYDVVGLRVFYDYLGYRNRLEVVYIELDRIVPDDDYPVPTFTDFLLQKHSERQAVSPFSTKCIYLILICLVTLTNIKNLSLSF